MNNNSYATGNSSTYQYGTGGSFSQGTYYNGSGRETGSGSNFGKNGKGHKAGTGKKVAIATCCGLCFGIFAGLGFQAVDSATDFLKDKVQKTEGSAAGGSTQAAENTDAVQDSTELLYSGLSEEEVKAIEELINKQTVHTTVTDVTEVVKQVMPSVVSVNNKYIERMTFFGQDFSQEVGGSGSGIIVGKNDTELLLVTNYHVVESAEELTVQFVDGTQSQAQIKGLDADKDLAVIAVQLTDIEGDTMNQIAIAKLGSSEELTVGEPVIAIGNALGYGQSVTTGVISALDRAIQTTATQSQSPVQNEDMEINTFIQTDAAINPGNSGGALLNSKGEVIGINSSKIGGSTIEGMGYAIPISDARPIIEDLMTKQTRLKVAEEDRGYLGITGVDVTSDSVQLYGLPRGVYVSSVTDGSGAAQAGLVRGDIITAINGEEVSSMVELKEELAYYAAGTTVELTIMQGSPTGYQAKTVSLTLGRSTQ
ncbi:MAG: PDZ domain-containing protein [Lachnospiraceae bacterium]|nr:PDZ domain-containing protein [Lachnospiraceae bacterium]MCI9095610.1 PDZ domain-containing protein [Lachnospiraceae bacterium]MCI9203951.1 PDZ domain-containing protein [Lachnospiraceae bacterium]